MQLHQFASIPIADLITVLLLALVSGVATYVDRLNKGLAKVGWLPVINVVTSSVVGGLSMLFLCRWQEWPDPVLFLGALLAGSSGIELINTFKERGRSWISTNFGAGS